MIDSSRSFRLYIFALVFTLIKSISLQAQCPLVLNHTQTFCDVETPSVGSLIAINQGNGVVWYATSTSMTPLSVSMGLINGEDYYADDNSGTCGVRNRVLVNIYKAPIGQNFQGVCVDKSSDATISNLIALGNDVKWYDSPFGTSPLQIQLILKFRTLC